MKRIGGDSIQFRKKIWVKVDKSQMISLIGAYGCLRHDNVFSLFPFIHIVSLVCCMNLNGKFVASFESFTPIRVLEFWFAILLETRQISGSEIHTVTTLTLIGYTITLYLMEGGTDAVYTS